MYCCIQVGKDSVICKDIYIVFCIVLLIERYRNIFQLLILNDYILNINFRVLELFEVFLNCEIDERSDVWLFGCILYVMVYGKFVFDGKRGRVL